MLYDDDNVDNNYDNSDVMNNDNIHNTIIIS